MKRLYGITRTMGLAAMLAVPVVGGACTEKAKPAEATKIEPAAKAQDGTQRAFPRRSDALRTPDAEKGSRMEASGEEVPKKRHLREIPRRKARE